jgi:hypothetical protein
MRRYANNNEVQSMIFVAVISLFLVSCQGAGGKNTHAAANKSKVNKEILTGSGQTKGGNVSIKEIKASHPDLSKVNNTKSTKVVRPMGSKIPKGTGKPEGSKKPIIKP